MRQSYNKPKVGRFFETRCIIVYTRVDSIDGDAAAGELASQFVGEHEVGQLGVLVRLQRVVRVLFEQEQIVHVERLKT